MPPIATKKAITKKEIIRAENKSWLLSCIKTRANIKTIK
jgi:hypothetical protein